jgi:hypothetical protein
MTQHQTRFQYGGHATFPVRYGWLSKGIDHLITTGGFTPNTDTADSLGLGSKMVESLSFWLTATGLCSHASDSSQRGATDLARIIQQHDPYLELPATWWFLHLTLARREGSVWSWFFNDFTDRIFDRQACVDAFLQHTKAKAQRPASEATASKDVACLLSGYAVRPGVDIVDPDDVGACPLRELGLIVRHDAVNRFERTRSPIAVPQEVFLAAASLISAETGKDALSLRELAGLRKGPGRILCAGLDSISSMVARAAKDRKTYGVHTETLAGELQLRVPRRPLVEWMTDLYARIEASAP